MALQVIEPATEQVLAELPSAGVDEADAAIARAKAAFPAWRDVSPGDRATLLFPPGLDFVVAFFGCLVAGVIAVPLMVPRRTAARDSSAAIIADCTPRIALSTSELLAARPDVADRFHGADFDWMTVSAMEDCATVGAPGLPLPTRRCVPYGWTLLQRRAEIGYTGSFPRSRKRRERVGSKMPARC